MVAALGPPGRGLLPIDTRQDVHVRYRDDCGGKTRLLTIVALLAGLALAGCGRDSGTRASHLVGRWTPFVHVTGAVDLTGPRSDGLLTVAASGRLSLLRSGGVLASFARGDVGYSTALGPEPYIAMTRDQQVAGPGCTFGGDELFAIEPSAHPSIIAVNAQGIAQRAADLPLGLMPNGIAFDDVGRFRHRLLVTASQNGETTLFAVDCHGTVATINSRLPRVEGGLSVAPASFGRFGGWLIAPDEYSGRIVAIDAHGRAEVLAKSGIPSGGDIGVESTGFVPPGFGPGDAAYVSDRLSKGSPTPGTNSILRLTGVALLGAGVRPGDLLVASEGGADTVVVHCAATCSVRHIAVGPTSSHGEGHIVFSGDNG